MYRRATGSEGGRRGAVGRGRGMRAQPPQLPGGEGVFNFARKLPGNIPEVSLGLQINSYATLICRAAVDNKYLVCTEHVLILKYFTVEYW